jgi:hypothetical protein
MSTYPDLPDFLRCIPGETLTDRGWAGRKLTRQGARFVKLDAAEERDRKKLQREHDRMQEEKKRARLAALRDRFND